MGWMDSCFSPDLFLSIWINTSLYKYYLQSTLSVVDLPVIIWASQKLPLLFQPWVELSYVGSGHRSKFLTHTGELEQLKLGYIFNIFLIIQLIPFYQPYKVGWCQENVLIVVSLRIAKLWAGTREENEVTHISSIHYPHIQRKEKIKIH